MRYELHHYWYTALYYASIDGTPVMRPMWFEFPADPRFMKVSETQFMIGDSLLYVPKLQSSNMKYSDLYDPTTVNNKHYDVNFDLP